MPDENDPVLEELTDIRKLLVLLLLKLGASQSEIARTLGVSQPSISRMIPGRIEPIER